MKTNCFEGITNSELKRLIDEWVNSKRDREIMKRRYIDGVCYESLAEEFDLSSRQIKNITHRCTEKMKEKLH